MRKVSYINNKFVFAFDYNKNIIEDIKNLEGRKYDPINKNWIVADYKPNRKEIKNIIEKYNFSIHSSIENKADLKEFFLQDDIRYHSHENNALKHLTDGKKQVLQNELKAILRSYQEEGIEYMTSNKLCINGDDMGLGKTIEAIGSTLILGFPCLVICPASIKIKWKESWEKWTNKKVCIYGLDECIDYDILIANYESIYERNDDNDLKQDFDKNWKVLIVDESHFVKNKKSIRSQKVKEIAKKSENIFLLTGTVIDNRPSDLINQLDVIDKLKDFGGWYRFITKYCGGYRGKFGWIVNGATNIPELSSKLRESCYIRRNKEDVVKELPAFQETIINVDIDNRSKYNKAENNLIEYLKNEYSSEKANKASNAEQLVLLSTLKSLSLEGKLSSIKEYIESFLESDKKLLVFTTRSLLIDFLIKEFKALKIDGSISANKRQDIINKFNNEDNNLIVCNMVAAGTGTDGLQDKCSDMLITDLPDKPGLLDQSISRLHRIGQLNSVNINFMLGANTIDQRLYSILNEKRLIADKINRGIDIENIDVDVNKQLIGGYLNQF